MEFPQFTRFLILFAIICAFVAVEYRQSIPALLAHSVALRALYKTNAEHSELAHDPGTTNKMSATLTTTSSSLPEHLMGLHVLHGPRTEENTVNLIFVHGLGGSAKETWTHSSKTFWPTLLHHDDRFRNTRISTFGYNANFKNVFAQKNALGITDFAKQLLDNLDLYYDKYGDV